MSLGRSISWIGISQLVALVLQFAGSVVLARYLTPHEMGIYAVAAATVALLGMLQAFGLQNLVVREEELTDEICTTVFTVNFLISILLVLSILAVSYLGGAALGDERVRLVLLALSISPVFGIFNFLPAARLERAGRFKALALAGIASSFVSAVVTIVAAIAGARYMTAAYAGWGSALTYTVIVNIAGHEFIRFRTGLRQWRRIAHFGTQMIATSGLHAIGIRFSDICLGKLQGLGALGIYSRASNLNAIVWNNINLAAGRVMFVDFAALYRQKAGLRERYIATVDVITALLWPAFAGLAVLSKPLIKSVYGEAWLPAALPLALLCISSIISVSITMTWELFTATGNLNRQTKIEFYIALLSTLLFATGSYFSLTAAAGSRILTAVISVIIYRPHLSRMTNTTSADFSTIYLRNAVLTLLAIAPATALMLTFGFSADVPVLWVLLSALLGATTWVGALFLLRHSLLHQFRKMLSRPQRETKEPQQTGVADGAPREVTNYRDPLPRLAQPQNTHIPPSGGRCG